MHRKNEEKQRREKKTNIEWLKNKMYANTLNGRNYLSYPNTLCVVNWLTFCFNFSYRWSIFVFVFFWFGLTCSCVTSKKWSICWALSACCSLPFWVNVWESSTSSALDQGERRIARTSNAWTHHNRKCHAKLFLVTRLFGHPHNTYPLKYQQQKLMGA